MSRRHKSLASLVALFTVSVMVALSTTAIHPADAGLLGGPVLKSISPNVITPGVGNQTLKLIGTDFLDSAATVEFGPSTGITQVGAPVFKSKTEIDVKVNVAENAPNTARDVTLTQDNLLTGGTTTCSKCVRIGPDITALSGSVANTGTSALFVVNGHAFKTGSSVKIERKSYGFNATESDTINIPQASVNVTPGTTANGEVSSLTATFSPLGRAPGRWKVTVIAPDGATAVSGDGITTGLQIIGSKPTLSEVTPVQINTGDTNKQLTLKGKGFARGMTGVISGSGVTQSAALDWHSATEAVLNVTVTAPSSDKNPRTLTLRNADDQSSTNVDALSLNQAPQAPGNPTISSVTPNKLGRGASNVTVIVAGTNFGPGALPIVSVSPNDVDPKRIDVQATRDSATQLTLSVSVGSEAAFKAYDLIITYPSPDTRTVTKASALNVTDEFTVSGLTPPGRPKGFTGNVEINGSGFSGAPTVMIDGLSPGTPVLNSPAKLTVPISVPANAPATARNVTVTINGTPKVCANCFTVGENPTVTSFSPGAGAGGEQVAVTVTGTNFKKPVVTLERAGQNNVTMTEVTANTTTTASGTFDLADAAPGEWNVRVTNEDGGTAVLASPKFTVTFSDPTVTSATPETVSQNSPTAEITLTGAHFAPGMAVTLPNAGGITVGDVTRLSTTSAKVKIAVGENATLGSRDVKVTNADGKSDPAHGTCPACFTVTAGQQPKNFGAGITAYENFFGGAFVAAGNLDNAPGNGTEFVLGANAGGGPHVRPYRINPANGQIQELGPGFFAYPAGFAGGVHVAVGNVDGNAANGDEIITGAGPGGGPHVRVFHLNNDLTVNEPFGGGFYAYGEGFKGGVWVATADLNGDGKDEIITGAGPGGGPHVKIWSLSPDNKFVEVGGFYAYDAGFQGGVAIAAGNVIPEASDPQKDEIITAPAIGGGPHVKVLNAQGQTLREFFAFNTSDDNGYRVTVGDFDFDTVDDIAVSRGSSGDIYVAQITASGPVALIQPNPAPFNNLPIGTNIAAADVDGDGDDDLIVTPDHSSSSTVRLIRPLALG